MPQQAPPELFERFRQGWEWWNCGELDLMQDAYAEDAEIDLSAVFTDAEPQSGREGMRRQWEKMMTTFEGLRWDPLEVFEVGGGRFVVELRMWGKGKRSGVEVDQRFAVLYTIRASDLKVTRTQLFPTVQAAFNFAAATRSPAQAP